MKTALRYYRKKAKLSQEQLAEITGFGASTIGNVETGRTQASSDFWEAMAKALKASKEDLLREIPEFDPSYSKDSLKETLETSIDPSPKVESLTQRALAAEAKVELMKKILRSLLDQL